MLPCDQRAAKRNFTHWRFKSNFENRFSCLTHNENNQKAK